MGAELVRRLFIVVLIVGAAVGVCPAAKDEAAGDYLAKLPPLIDRDVFFGDPQTSGAQISPDGKWISFLRPYRNVRNVWVKKTEEPFDAARPITADTKRPVTGYGWTEDSRYVLYVQDKGGDENYHLYAVDPAGPATGEAAVPEARDLTPFENVRVMLYALPERTPKQIIIGLNDRDPALHDVYRLNVDSGERTLLVRNDSNVGAWVVDLDGRVRLAWRQTEDGGSEIVRVEDGKLGRTLYSCNFEESCEPDRFHKDGKRVYIHSDKGADVDLARLLLLDAESGAVETVESDPQHEVDFGAALFSDKTEELIGTVYVGDRQRIYPRSKQLERDLKLLHKQLPDGELDLVSTTEDEHYSIVAVSRDVNPGQVFLYDRTAGRTTKLYDSRPDLPSEKLAPMRAVRYKTRDGATIPAYLTVPKGVAGRRVPTVLLPHGGPWGRDTWDYDAIAQFLANRGYAVLQPNFRGSTGYGKRFLNAGNKEWGTGIMQHDLSDAVRYLVDEGIADPKRIAILGGSYGGYATLAGVTFTPDLYAAGVSIVGPSNIITLLKSIPPYWGPIRKIFYKRVGDPDDPADRTRLEAQSPFFHAEQIKAPLLVIQGANDPRVKKAESDQIVVALRERERPVEYIVAPDEGHGFAGKENRLAMFAVIEEFLARHIVGRYQRDAAKEIQDRIAALRVDVRTVEMPHAASGVEQARSAPLPTPDASALRPMKLHYSSELKLTGGMEMKAEITRELASDTLGERSVWRVETRMSMPKGEVTDVFYLDAKSLAPLRREVTQGPVSVSLDYTDQAIEGTIKAPGQELPVKVKLEAPVLAEDAALEAILAVLPLAAGYRTTLRTFDTQSQTVRLWSFEVAGIEPVTVPAGQFSAYKTTVQALDGEGGGGTFWIRQELPRRTVRSEIALPPAMGGGSVTSVLTAELAP